jgi:parallel beta-helix repeat protein
VIRANGSVTDKDFLWIEGNLDAEGDSYAVTFTNIRFSVLRDVTADKGGISFDSSSYNRLSGVAVSSSPGFSLDLYSSSNNTFSGVTVANCNYGFYLASSSDNNTFSGLSASNTGYGVYLSSSSNNTFSGLDVSNNSFGVYLSVSSNNTFSGVTAMNNDFGIHILNSSDNILSEVSVTSNTNGLNIGSSPNNTVTGITAASNIYALTISYSPDNTFSGATLANNNNGVIVFSSPNTTFSGVTSADNYYGISLSSSSNNYFTGPLKVDNNLLDCLVDGGTNAGLVNTTCTVDGTDGSSDYGIGNISDATFTPSVTLTSSFVGKVYSDATNSSDTGSAVTYPADPATFDWTNFENAFRGWGLDGAFGNFASQGRWTSGNDGAIWDWSLASGYTVIRNVLLPPTGDDTLTHLWSATNSGDCGSIAGAIWGGNICSLPGYTGETACTDAGGDWLSDKCYSVYLRNAVEISGDDKGNDNTLCESDETCLYSPNMASYQGHGNLIDAGFIGNGGTLENITLMQYETNGR